MRFPRDRSCRTAFPSRIGLLAGFASHAMAAVVSLVVAECALGQTVIPAGSSASNSVPTHIVGTLDVQGTYTANAPLTLDWFLQVSAGGVFTMNDSVSTPGSFYNFGGTLNLNAGTMTVDAFSANSTINQNGGNYIVNGLILNNGVAMTYGPADVIGISGYGGLDFYAGSKLTTFKPLDVTFIGLNGGSILELANWSDTWNGQPVAARVREGNRVPLLTGYANANLLQFTNAPGPVLIQYDAAANTTFVTAVPEPATYAMALAGVASGGFSMWRRRRRA